MNLFELNHCPLCNSKLNDVSECEHSSFKNAKIEIFGLKFIDHFYYKYSGFLLFKENSICIDLGIDKAVQINFNFEKILYDDSIDIELTESNLEEIINILNTKAEIATNNLLFL